jgi:transcriptional regulator with XRE-family HTH domain
LEAVEAPPEPVMAVPEIPREVIAHEVRSLPRPEGPYRTKTVGKHALGPRLRELREFKNLTQADIAKRAHVPRTYISRIERAHLMPGLGVLQRLSGALEVGLLDLVPGSAASRVPNKFTTPEAVGEAAGISSDSYWDSLVRYSRSLAEDQKVLILSKVRAMLGPHPIGRVA